MLVWRERFRLDVWRWPDDCLSGLVSCRSSMHELLSEFSLKLPSRMSRILFLPSWRRQSASSSPMFTNSPTLFSLISPLRIQFRWSKKNHRCACQNIFANEFPHDKTTRACSSHFFYFINARHSSFSFFIRAGCVWFVAKDWKWQLRGYIFIFNHRQHRICWVACVHARACKMVEWIMTVQFMFGMDASKRGIKIMLEKSNAHFFRIRKSCKLLHVNVFPFEAIRAVK